jgi:hypothetical protein
MDNVTLVGKQDAIRWNQEDQFEEHKDRKGLNMDDNRSQDPRRVEFGSAIVKQLQKKIY